MVNALLSRVAKYNRHFLMLAGFILIGLIGIIDYLTGYEYAFSLFYMLPISLITWIGSQRLGFAASITSSVVWTIADATSGNPYSNTFVPLWNSLIRLAFFIIITFLLSKLKKLLQLEKELSRTDYLTSAINSRYFYEMGQMEIDRSKRYHHPFTIAYIDLDNFKTVNDQFGHRTGDLVLQTVVASIQKRIRKTDVVARIGGDEFTLLFPETNQESAHIILTKIHCALLEEMQQNNWPVTFSIGVLTCVISPDKIDELVEMADRLMYLAKFNGKNAVEYSTYTG